MATLILLMMISAAGFYVFALFHFWREWNSRRYPSHIRAVRSGPARVADWPMGAKTVREARRVAHTSDLKRALPEVLTLPAAPNRNDQRGCCGTGDTHGNCKVGGH